MEVIADDPELLRVMNRMEHGPKPNLLLAAVHYLISKGGEARLSEFYASQPGPTLPPEGAGPHFRDFVLDNEESLVEIGATRYTQTNECRRCTALLPMIWLSEFQRFHLVDLGTSAGLNLAIDRYAYRWGPLKWGSGSLLLDSSLRGGEPRIRDIEVLSRTGLDLNIIDPGSRDDRAWIEALVWPEHADRRARLRAALDLTVSVGPEFVAGDAVESLEQVLASLPAGEPAVVMSSFVLIQMSEQQIAAIDEISQSSRRSRPVFRVSMESEIRGDVGARLVIDDGGGPTTVGTAHHHGEWLDLSDG